MSQGTWNGGGPLSIFLHDHTAFLVPNHALGAWLAIGLLGRQWAADAVDLLLPITLVAVALWSPLAALASCPSFCGGYGMSRCAALDPAVPSPHLGPALAVGLVIAAYLTLDAGRIRRAGHRRSRLRCRAITDDLWRQAEFFLLEAGFLGFAILSIRRSAAVILALCVLAVLPFGSFGGANDFVMRVSIPSLTVLAIGACLALFAARSRANLSRSGADHGEPSRQEGGVGGIITDRCGDAFSGVRARRGSRSLARQSRRHAHRRLVRDFSAALRCAAPGSTRRGVAAVAAHTATRHSPSNACANPAFEIERRRAQSAR